MNANNLVVPATTLLAAVIAGLFSRWIASTRLGRLKAAIELQDRIDSSQQRAWRRMIMVDTEGVLRQATQVPQWILSLPYIGVVGTLASLPFHNTAVTLVAEVIALMGVVLYVPRVHVRTRDMKRVNKRLAEQISDLENRLNEAADADEESPGAR